jgi:hypothetical protein
MATTPAVKVTVKPGDTISAIAKANGLTTSQVLAMNPALTSNPKYNGGNTIFAGTKVVVSPAVKSSTPPPTTPPPVPKVEEQPITETKTETTLTTSTIDYSTVLPSSVSSTPDTPLNASTTINIPPAPTKTAPIDTVLFNDDSMSIEIMTDLIFEDIGGHELINIARNDIVNGQRISYSPIKNLGLIQQKYNPNNILNFQLTSEKYFNNFPIKLEEKIPKEGNGVNGSNVYFDEITGDLIIETVSMNADEQLEVQIAINGTIYEANFGEITS